MAELPFERSFREWTRAEGMGWESVRYSRSGAPGETTALRITPRRPARGVVLAAHGAGNDSLFGWVGLFRALLERGLEVFSVELDGHGRSGTTRFDPATAASSIREAAERSGARGRGLPLHAVGVSLGGSLLLHALPSLPEIASAVLLAAPLTIDFSWRSVRGELRLPLVRALWRGRGLYGLTGLIPSFGPVKRSMYPLRLAAEPGPGPFGYVEVLNSALEALRLEEAARSVTVPVLLVYGEEDRVVPPVQGERLARLIPDSELLRLPGETHLTAPLAPAAVAGTVEWMGKYEVPSTKYQGGREAPGTRYSVLGTPGGEEEGRGK